MTLEETIKELALLSNKKASQGSRIPVKLITENLQSYAKYIGNLLSFTENIDLK